MRRRYHLGSLEMVVMRLWRGFNGMVIFSGIENGARKGGKSLLQVVIIVSSNQHEKE